MTVRWQKVETLFLRAADLEPAERDAFMSVACADDDDIRDEVEAMLRSESEADGFISRTVTMVAQDFADRVTSSRVGERIGAYRLIDVIGHGGMGTVYLAERADDAYRARVAIKFVRGAYAAPELTRRFIAERQILADLDHPCIARLLDGGATPDGTPYLVLEYVDGVPINSWCDARGLGVRERVELFLKVCDAVQYAHGARVVHRDLKPSNILVRADGTPKLVDFGIARLVSETGGQETTSALQVLTPAYASPEQVRGTPVTFSSDVYSLGVVFYELLAGRLPLDLSGAWPGEMERRICDEVPPPLSRAATTHDASWRRNLAGDLDAIAATALKKRSDQRFASVSALAAELGTWLSAPAGSRRRRSLWRRITRRPVAVLAATAAALVITAVGSRALAARRDAAIALRFLPAQQVNTGIPAPFTVVRTDVNGDGRSDLVWNHVTPDTNLFAVGLGQADGTFLVQPVVTAPLPDETWRGFRLLVADLDGDGRDELLWNRVGSTALNFAVVGFSNPDGSFRFNAPFRFGHESLRWADGWQPLIGDVDADGDDDLVFNYLDQRNLVRAYISRGDGTFTEQGVIEHFARRWTGYRAFVADVDGDRRADIVWNDVPVWANRTYVARFKGSGLDLLQPENHAVSDGWSGFTTAVADVDGDRKSDIVWLKAAADSIEVYVARGTSTGAFAFMPGQRFHLPSDARLTSPVSGDFNGDGRSDLVWGDSTSERLVVLRGSRSGIFTIEATNESGPEASRYGAGAVDRVVMDVNGDGRDDLVLVDRASGQPYVAVAAPRSWPSSR